MNAHTCPAWCSRDHADPAHHHDVATVEAKGWAFDVALFQNGTAAPDVALYVHTGTGEHGETLAVHLAPEHAATLGAALGTAVGLIGGAR